MGIGSREKRFYFLVSAAALFVALFPLFSVNCIQGHDLSYHLLRIESLKEGILNGVPFTKVNLLFFGGRGYASSLFYPDLLLYFPALLRCMGVSIGASFHLFVALCILLAHLSMYFSVKAIASHLSRGDEMRPLAAGTVAAVAYTLAQYHLDDIYTRSAVGEYTAMIFVPILIYGIYDMLLGGMRRPLLMAAGFSGLILCHTTTTVFMAALYVPVFIYALVYRIIRGRMRAGWILRIVLAGFSALLLTAFYWVPVLEMLTTGRFQTDAAGFDLNYERLMLKDVFVDRNPAMGAALPLVCLLLVLAFVAMGRNKKAGYLAGILALAALIFTLGSTGLLPWKQLQGVLGFVQFPWRLFVVASPLFAAASGLFVCSLSLDTDEMKYTLTLAAAGILIFAAAATLGRIDECYYSYSDDYYSYVPFTGSVIGGEWLPERVRDRDALLKDTDIAKTNYGGQLEVSRAGGELTLDLPSPMKYVDIPLIYYAGYTALAENGENISIRGDGANGCARLYFPPEGRIRVFYGGTTAQHVSGLISMIFLFVLAFFRPFRVKRA